MLALVAGCGAGAREDDARAAATAFVAALEQRDAVGACEQLTSAAFQSLEAMPGQVCENEVLSVESPGASIADVEVYAVNAIVRFDSGSAVFTEETATGWRVAAAGCQPSQSGRYTCQVEG